MRWYYDFTEKSLLLIIDSAMQNHIVLSVGDALGLKKSDASGSRRSKGKNLILEGQMAEREILPGSRLDRLV